MLFAVLYTVLALASSLTAYHIKGRKSSIFCFTSQGCPDMQFCGKQHQCRFPLNLREYLTVSKIYTSRQRQISTTIQTCKRHMDCKQIGYICDIPDGICRRFEVVFPKMNKCKDFKKSCRSDADCSCPGKHMICEAEPSGMDSECVIRGRRSLSAGSRKRVSNTKRKADLYKLFNF